MSNIAPQSRFQFDKNKHILRQDIIFADSRAHNLLQWTKTLQESTSRHFVQIPALSNLVICSVLALKQLIASRCLSQSSPLFANNVPPYLPVIDTIRDALHLDHIGIPLLGHGFYIFRRSGATYAYDNVGREVPICAISRFYLRDFVIKRSRAHLEIAQAISRWSCSNSQ